MSNVVELQRSQQINIACYFLGDRIKEGKGDRRALITSTGDWSYRQVQALSDALSWKLQKLEVQPEQRVLIALPDSPAFVGAFFGILQLGAVVVMANPELSKDELAYLLKYTRAAVVITTSSKEQIFAELQKNTSSLKHTLFIQERDTEAVSNDFDSNEKVQEESWNSGFLCSHRFQIPTNTELNEIPSFPPFLSHRDDAAIWLFSGGTTGRPKAVVQSHGSFIHTTQCYAHGVLGYRDDDICVSVPKLYFGYATGSNLLFPFSVGAAVVLLPGRSTPELIFQAVHQNSATILINVPTMIGKMLAYESASAEKLHTLRIVTSAGEALPIELYEQWKKKFQSEVLDGLGTAEMWHVFLSNRPGNVRPGTLGQVVPGFEVRVCDDSGNEIPCNETGWLWVKGKARALGYWQMHDRSCQAFRGEWYVSGDMVSCDEDGYFTYCGRGDDMLKVSGKWLAPAEVENCLLQHGRVSQCAVVGVEDERGLIKPWAFVVPNSDRGSLDKELDEFLRKKLELYKVPRQIKLLDSLPQTHLGKTDRGRLRSMFRERSKQGGKLP